MTSPPNEPGAQRVAGCVPSCRVKGCSARAAYTPVLHVIQLDQRVSQVALPVYLCRVHLDGFKDAFLTPERRASMETALRARGLAAPDWTLTRVEFERA